MKLLGHCKSFSRMLLATHGNLCFHITRQVGRIPNEDTLDRTLAVGSNASLYEWPDHNHKCQAFLSKYLFIWIGIFVCVCLSD